MALNGAQMQSKLCEAVQRIVDYKSDQTISADSLLRSLDPSSLGRRAEQYQGLTPLWFLAVVAMDYDANRPETKARAIEIVLEKWNVMLVYTDFLIAPKDQARKNRTVLWFLAAAAQIAIAPKAFNLVWDYWGEDDIDLEELLFADIDGISPLWWLAKAANPVFIKVWQKWGKQLSSMDLRARVEGEYEGQSLQWLMVDAAQTQLSMRPLVEKMLSSLPDVFSKDDISDNPKGETSIEEKLRGAGDWGRKIQVWIEARNNFFHSLKIVDQKNEISLTDYEEVRALAERAASEGYVNASKDLKEFFSVNIHTSLDFISYAMTKASSEKERINFLRQAFTYALRVPVVPPGDLLFSRTELLAKIACCYISEGRKVELERGLPTRLFQKIKGAVSIWQFFSYCADGAEIYEFAQSVMSLQGKMTGLEDSFGELQLLDHPPVIAPAYAAAAVPVSVAPSAPEQVNVLTKNSRSFFS